MDNKPSVLFLSAELPYPPYSGGKLKSFKLLSYLHQHYRVTLATILKMDDEGYLDTFVDKLGIQQYLAEPVNRPRNILNLLMSYLQGVPINLFRTASTPFKNKVHQIIHSFDIVLIDHYEAFQYIPKNYEGSIILHQHNAYHLMWQRFAEDTHQPMVKRIVSYLESLRVKQKEKQYCQQSDLIFASPNDIETLSAMGIDKNKFHYTYHLGDDSQLDLPSLSFHNTEKALLYIGTLNWEANVDGLVWFIKTVWPLLIVQHPTLRFTIIGKNADARIVDLCHQHEGIKLAGFVEDIEPYCTSHRVFVAPLRFGAGMKVKVLNAMCRGIPVSTTSIGCEGMQVEDNQHLCIADDADKMAQDIHRLLTDPDHWHYLESESRQRIEQQYTWQSLFTAMGKAIDAQHQKKTQRRQDAG